MAPIHVMGKAFLSSTFYTHNVTQMSYQIITYGGQKLSRQSSKLIKCQGLVFLMCKHCLYSIVIHMEESQVTEWKGGGLVLQLTDSNSTKNTLNTKTSNNLRKKWSIPMYNGPKQEYRITSCDSTKNICTIGIKKHLSYKNRIKKLNYKGL